MYHLFMYLHSTLNRPLPNSHCNVAVCNPEICYSSVSPYHRNKSSTTNITNDSESVYFNIIIPYATTSSLWILAVFFLFFRIQHLKRTCAPTFVCVYVCSHACVHVCVRVITLQEITFPLSILNSLF